jgi:transposase
MGKVYLQDLRRRVVDCIASGHSCRAAGRVFAVSACTAIRLAAEHRATGRLASKRQGRAPGTAGRPVPHRLVFIDETSVRSQHDTAARPQPRG